MTEIIYVKGSSRFDLKWFTVEKLTASDLFTAVKIETRGHKVYNTNIAILFTFQTTGSVQAVCSKFHTCVSYHHYCEQNISHQTSQKREKNKSSVNVKKSLVL